MVIFSVGWLIDSDGDILDEVDVDLDCVVLPDDQLVRLAGLVFVLSGLADSDLI